MLFRCRIHTPHKKQHTQDGDISHLQLHKTRTEITAVLLIATNTMGNDDKTNKDLQLPQTQQARNPSYSTQGTHSHTQNLNSIETHLTMKRTTHYLL